MADYDAVSAEIKEALDLSARCSQAESSEGYDDLKEDLDELESAAKAAFQNHEDYRSLVKKLESGSALSPDELNTLKLLIVGDAEYYLKYDGDFDRCKTALKTILDEIRSLQSSSLDVDSLMHLRVLCREAVSMLVPTSYYLEQKERLQKFQDATSGGIDRESAQVLAHILRESMGQ